MKLESGKTIIGRSMAKQKDGGEQIPVDIIYVSDEEGLINVPDGSTRIIAGENYKKFLNKYLEEQKKEEREKKLNDIVPTGTARYEQEQSDFFFDDEEDDFITDDAEDDEDESSGDHTQLAVVNKKRQDEKKKRQPKNNKSKSYEEELQEQSGKLPSKNIKVAILILIIIAVIEAGFLIVPRVLKSGNSDDQSKPAQADTYAVAVLKNDVEQGSPITEEDIEEKSISAEDYETLSRTVYVGADGENHTGTVVTWNKAENYIGRLTLRTLKQGDVLMADDLEAKEEDGATSEKSAMQMRIVAIITSDDLEEDMMIELGRYVFTTGQLQDILNAQNESMLPESETQAEGETQPEGETEK